MENERTENMFYLNLKHVHKYGCTKFQPNPLFSSQQTATESAAEEKKIEQKKKKSRQAHRGSHQGTGCPNNDMKQDMMYLHLLHFMSKARVPTEASVLKNLHGR